MGDLKAIETVYNGYRFRSRLEARWAVFFDAMGIKYDYEKEGYDLGRGLLYLPDFWLPDLRSWVEIKPNEPSEIESEKCELLSRQGNHNVLMLIGSIPSPQDEITTLRPLSSGTRYIRYDSAMTGALHSHIAIYFGGGGFDYPYFWCQCPICHRVSAEFMGATERICNCIDGDKGYCVATNSLLSAYESARTARFEHGEIPLSLGGGF